MSNSILALDVGGRRIGVARADTVARLPSPLLTLINDDKIFEAIQQLVIDHAANTLVVGLPRNMAGEPTAQTRDIQDFVKQLQDHINIPIYWQDESVTSRKAEQELRQRGKPFTKGDIDALAATYILEDFLHDKLDEEERT